MVGSVGSMAIKAAEAPARLQLPCLVRVLLFGEPDDVDVRQASGSVAGFFSGLGRVLRQVAGHGIGGRGSGDIDVGGPQVDHEVRPADCRCHS